MIAMNFSPPPVAHDAATQLAQVYLAAAVDPVATKARLEELNEATQAYRVAIDEYASVAAKAAEVTAAQDAVTVRELSATAREQALASSQTALDVASAAVMERERGLASRSADLDQRETGLAAREKSLADRLEAYRRALA